VKRLLLATSNPGKILEFQSLLGSHFACVTPRDLTLTAPEVTEDGTTFFENALKKAIAYAAVYSLPVLADDSGLEVNALEGRPGVHSARFGGVGMPWEARWHFLFAQLKSVPQEQWTAQFRTVLCYYDGTLPHFFEGIAKGRLVSSPRGEEGFGYDPIFLSDDLGKTFAEASPEEKSQVSHRGRAVRQFLAWSAS
jgi:XTP/dITP diphosphohydrolase